MYARILVAVDGSDPSRSALDEAVRLAADQHAQLRIVQVVEMQWVAGAELVDFVQVEEALRASAAVTLEHAVEIAQRAAVAVESGLLETDGGTVAHAVVEEANRWLADLIVVGTHGHHGLAHLVLGSVAEGVVRTARVPVLLLRGSEGHSSPI
jgi:nucleotide-binding universal stress UspA family protein